jgi:hypothetical protein
MNGAAGEGADLPVDVKPLPARATNARPGSKRKLRVLCRRFRRDEALHHPGDAPLAGAAALADADAELRGLGALATACRRLPADNLLSRQARAGITTHFSDCPE